MYRSHSIIHFVRPFVVNVVCSACISVTAEIFGDDSLYDFLYSVFNSLRRSVGHTYDINTWFLRFIIYCKLFIFGGRLGISVLFHVRFLRSVPQNYLQTFPGPL